MSLPPFIVNVDSRYYPDQVARMMREYGLAVREAALEEAARLLELEYASDQAGYKRLKQIAGHIRALKNA